MATSQRLTETQFRLQQIEWQEKINFQVIRELRHKHEGQTVKADTAQQDVATLKHNFTAAKTKTDIALLDSQITAEQKTTKVHQLDEAKNDAKLAGVQKELKLLKGMEVLRGISLEIDQLQFDNGNDKIVAEALGVTVSERRLEGVSIKGFLRSGLQDQREQN